MRYSGCLKSIVTLNYGGGGSGTGWRGGRKDGDIKSKAALLSMSNLYSTLHDRYFQCVIGEKLSI